MGDDMIGRRFTRLVVERAAEDYVSPSGSKHKRYICKCDCGNVVEVLKEHLLSKRQKSCGCLRKQNGIKTHGEIHTRLYKIWGNMLNRCSNRNNPAWDRYGQRGITVCDDWKHYECFRDWAITNGYADDLTIDRINNDEGYSPCNCRWVDNLVQANNKSNNHFVTYNGETRTIADWSKVLGIPYKTLHNRIVSLGWEIERAFNQPLRINNSNMCEPNTKDC